MNKSNDKTTQFDLKIKTGSSDSILASIFRDILFNTGVTPMRFNTLIEKYIVRAKIPRDIRKLSSVRGNLKKELLKSTMTWKVFIRGLLFLNIKKMEISVKLHDATGRVSIHSKVVHLSEVEGEDLDE